MTRHLGYYRGVIAGLIASAVMIGYLQAQPVTDNPADSASGTSEGVVIQATGSALATLATAREEAIADAQRRCVEQAGGTELTSISQSSQFRLVADAVYTRSTGYIVWSHFLAENRNQNGLYTVRIEALVRSVNINADLMAFKKLLERKHHPRILIVSKEDGGRAESELSSDLNAELQQMLRDRGFDVISWGVMNADQNKRAREAAHGDLDPDRAAKIAGEVSADYFVIVRKHAVKYEPKTLAGIQFTPIDLSAWVEVVSTDTARLLTSPVKKFHIDSRNPERDIDQQTDQLSQASLQTAIGNLAEDWLTEVAKGREVEVAFYKSGRDRIDEFVNALRADRTVPVREVIVRNIDERGYSKLGVFTTLSAGDLTNRLDQLECLSGSSVSLSENRIEIIPRPRQTASRSNTKIFGLLVAMFGLAGLLGYAIWSHLKNRVPSRVSNRIPRIPVPSWVQQNTSGNAPPVASHVPDSAEANRAP